MLIDLPFSGFYESRHDAELDDALEQICQDDNGVTDDDKYEKAFELVNWKNAHVFIANAYCEYLAAELNIKLEFQALDSPREYNFETDRIFAEISLDEFKRIYDETDYKILKSVIIERHTSRQGFHSFYSDDIDQWPEDLSEYDLNEAGTVLIAYMRTLERDDIEEAFIESMMCNGGYSEAVYSPGMRAL